MDELADLLTSLGVEQPAPAADPAPNNDPPPADPPAPEDNTDPVDPPADDTPPEEPKTPPQTPPANNKAANAFAQMRVENKQYRGLVDDLAKILGVAEADNKTESVKQAIVTALAKTQNVPPELLQRIREMEEKTATYETERIERQAYLGFQTLKDTYKLTDDDLRNFAGELQADGINPFEAEVNVLNEYKIRRHDDLIKKAYEDGIRAESERAQKAAQQATTPLNRQGNSAGDPEKITTASQLGSWLDKLK